jgi:ubiquinol-cytochrome c reductase iron-sulfur subunit
VTRDGGELSVARRDTSASDLPQVVQRRHLLAGGAIAAVGGLLALFGLRRWAPVPPQGSAWFARSPLLTLDGRALRPEDVPLGGVVTVWPEGAVGTERAAVMVIRLRERPIEPTRLDGVVDDTLVAYSRLCTHAGCAVALYRDVDQALFCPCHQATFDARRAATPMSGPASVALPQLPLGLADDGSLVATGDLTARPGPVGGTVRR